MPQVIRNRPGRMGTSTPRTRDPARNLQGSARVFAPRSLLRIASASPGGRSQAVCCVAARLNTPVFGASLLLASDLAALRRARSGYAQQLAVQRGKAKSSQPAR